MCLMYSQGNYSDVLVTLSNIYSRLRGDTSGVKNEDSAQGFVRSTTKYWVRTQDATTVKHHILQHLPVFQFREVCSAFKQCHHILYFRQLKLVSTEDTTLLVAGNWLFHAWLIHAWQLKICLPC